jgi:hypothetical protein
MANHQKPKERASRTRMKVKAIVAVEVNICHPDAIDFSAHDVVPFSDFLSQNHSIERLIGCSKSSSIAGQHYE